jgi:hypothetical protein
MVNKVVYAPLAFQDMEFKTAAKKAYSVTSEAIKKMKDYWMKMMAL